MITAIARQLVACQRTLIVALALIPLILALTASLPALALLPALPHGTARSAALITHFRRWTETVLTTSR
ncbi:hypothetical protein BX285_6659 [Streptomyces sp. 1114.5]|uniref:hypothetical protein n=1 Tax=Streptomyces sp. 1114.5 TaxID=1938830 RepID=UPI000EB1A8AB|nr:hypothetical protein [Streptomyces sp. 1114.5]RKT09564.1 hypothetical protein BX285_6659 [Streptomyces sp. 1114.5]